MEYLARFADLWTELNDTVASRDIHVVEEAAPVDHESGAGRVRGRGRGRSPGYRLDEKNRLKMLLGRQSRLNSDNGATIGSLVESVLPDHAAYCARSAFGEEGTLAAHRMIGDGTAALESKRRGRNSDGFKTAVDRALVSHCKIQALGLQHFLHDDVVQVLNTHVTSTFDDASLWISDPKDGESDDSDGEPQPISAAAKCMQKKGGNVHTPVCSIVESAFCRRADGDTNSLRAVEIHSPGIVLPLANTSTIRDRWKSWCICSSSGSGCKVDPDGDLGDGWPRIQRKNLIVQKDNLNLNESIIGLEHKVIKERKLTDGSELKLCSLNCLGHSCVLACKEAVEKLEGLPGILVKLGRLGQSGRISKQVRKLIGQEAGCMLNYQIVDDCPELFYQWREHARLVLSQSVVAKDLNTTDVELILHADNGDWNDTERLDHLCLRHKCPLGCNGNPKKAKRKVVNAVQMSLGSLFYTPLAYRWKGVEVAAAKAHRGLGQHALWLDVLTIMYPVVEADAAAIDLQALGQADAAAMAAGQEPADGNEGRRLRLKRKARGGAVVKYFSEPDAKQKVETAVLMQQGLQHYLNCCLAAEADVFAYVECLRTGEGDYEKLRKTAIQRNLSLVSGEAAKDFIRSYCELIFDLDGRVWAQSSLDATKRFTVTSGMLMIVSEMWWRLVFCQSVPRNEIMLVARHPERSAVAAEAIQHDIEPIKVAYAKCELCVEPHWAIPWCEEFSNADPLEVLNSHTAMCDIVATLPATSARVERKHLLGQEAKLGKRGRALSASQVQRLMYR